MFTPNRGINSLALFNRVAQMRVGKLDGPKSYHPDTTLINRMIHYDAIFGFRRVFLATKNAFVNPFLSARGPLMPRLTAAVIWTEQTSAHRRPRRLPYLYDSGPAFDGDNSPQAILGMQDRGTGANPVESPRRTMATRHRPGPPRW